MGLTEPENMDDLLYFTNRGIKEGKVKAWVYKKLCPQCKKEKMGKPVGDEGNIKIRAKEYQCPGCKYTEEKKEHEESLNLEAKYTCPDCMKQGEGATLYKRKKFQGADAYVVECQHCKAKIPITKKLKGV
ncbi:hypothetical protein HYY69_00365 [Candidatus Woesearchaeota archaeon]|nr:hypothetical protein [Candidatus Woesearchaeota archaeon]